MEVAAREGVDERAQTGREADVGYREAVGHEFDRGGVVTHGEQRAEVHDLDRKAAGRPDGKAHERGEEGEPEARGDGSGCGPLGGRAAQERRQAEGQKRGRRGRDLGHDQAGREVVGRGQGEDHAASSRGARPDRIKAGGRLPRAPAYQSADRVTCGSSDDSTTWGTNRPSLRS